MKYGKFMMAASFMRLITTGKRNSEMNLHVDRLRNFLKAYEKTIAFIISVLTISFLRDHQKARAL